MLQKCGFFQRQLEKIKSITAEAQKNCSLGKKQHCKAVVMSEIHERDAFVGKNTQRLNDEVAEFFENFIQMNCMVFC